MCVYLIKNVLFKKCKISYFILTITKTLITFFFFFFTSNSNKEIINNWGEFLIIYNDNDLLLTQI